MQLITTVRIWVSGGLHANYGALIASTSIRGLPLVALMCEDPYGSLLIRLQMYSVHLHVN